MAANWRKTITLAAALLITSGLAWLATPRAVLMQDYPKLEERVPKQVGPWANTVANLSQVAAFTGDKTDMTQPYNEVLSRTYVGADGAQVMLTLAWGQKQRQEVKVHRPDLCYVAQGYKVVSLSAHSLKGFEGISRTVLAHRMVAQDNRGYEAVTYWMRVGSDFSEGALDTRMHIIREGLQGRIPDGILVRASVRANSAEAANQAFPMLDQFLLTLYKSSPAEVKPYLVR